MLSGRSSARGCIALGLALCAAPAAAAAGAGSFQILAPALEPLAVAVQEATYGGDRELAERLLARLLESYPDEPGPLLLRLKLDWWFLIEGRDIDGARERRQQADFERLRELAEARLRRHPRDVEALYTLGEAYSTLGRLEAIRGHAWATLRDHQKGTSLLRQALALQPDLPAPRATIGLCHYYAARLPGCLRLLGRVLRLEADRDGGLRELEQAAAAPGVQQVEAMFFRLEVLHEMEDENLEALPLAQRLHARYPRNIGFTAKLADVLQSLERPDLAVRTLAPAAEDASDSCAALQARFFVARLYCTSGRAADGLDRLAALTPAELQRVTWLPAWRELYMGIAEAELGHVAAAEKHDAAVLAAPDIADAHNFARQESVRARDPLLQASRRAAGILAWDGDAAAARDSLEKALRTWPRSSPASLAQARSTLGLAALRLGDHAYAAERLAQATTFEDAEDACMITGPRIRLLQALLWAGRLDEARARAELLRSALGHWGSNRQLELLVHGCLEPSAAPAFAIASWSAQPGRSTHFRLKDTGFTSVALLRLGVRRPEPMRLLAGYWEIDVPVPPGSLQYVFQVEGQQRCVDPAAGAIQEHDGLLWSVRDVAAGSAS